MGYLDANRPHAWPASTVGDAEGLVQIEMRHISACIPRPTLQNLQVYV